MDDTKDFMMELLVERNQLRAALTRMQQHANEAEERRRHIVDQLNTLQCVHSTVASELVITMERLEDIQNVISSRHIPGTSESQTIMQICQDLDDAEAKLGAQGFDASTDGFVSIRDLPAEPRDLDDLLR